MFGRKKTYRKKSITTVVLNIATIISTVVISLKLTIYGIVSIETAGLVMVGVVIFVAIGNSVAKIILSIVALLLFVALYSQGNNEAFAVLLQGVLTIVVMLIGLYIIIKGIFGR